MVDSSELSIYSRMLSELSASLRTAASPRASFDIRDVIKMYVPAYDR
jgi:hypothetical protein